MTTKTPTPQERWKRLATRYNRTMALATCLEEQMREMMLEHLGSGGANALDRAWIEQRGVEFLPTVNTNLRSEAAEIRGTNV
jgi:hypothetical protein